MQTKLNNKLEIEKPDLNVDPSILGLFRRTNSGNYQLSIPIVIKACRENNWTPRNMNLLSNAINEDEFFETDEHIKQFFNVYFTLEQEYVFWESNQDSHIKVSKVMKDKLFRIGRKYSRDDKMHYLSLLEDDANREFVQQNKSIPIPNTMPMRGKQVALWGYKPSTKTFGNVPFGSGVVHRIGCEDKDEAIIETINTLLLGKGFGTALVTSGHMALYRKACIRKDIDIPSRYELGYVRRSDFATMMSEFGNNLLGRKV